MRHLFIIVSICTLSLSLGAQDFISLNKASSSLKKSYAEGMKYYKSNDFVKAKNVFNKIIKKENKFIDAYIILGSIGFDLGEFDLAETNFNKAILLNADYQPKVFYTLAICNYSNQHYKEAFDNMSIFLSKENSNQDLIIKAEHKIINYRFADSATRNPVRFIPVAIQTLNSEWSEYLPSLTADGKTMVFTRKIENENEDLFITTKSDSGIWSEPKNLVEINTPLNEGAPSISADGNTLVFVSCDRREGMGGCDLYISNKKNNSWSIPVNMGEKINTPAYETQPCIADNGKLILFSSNRIGGYGGSDIWMSVKNKSNAWIKPINLGPVINTKDDERCPFLHQDGKTLYFSSNGHPGMGSNDIYYSQMETNNSWSTPINLGYPINGPLDESSFVAYFDGKKALMASDRLFLKEKDPRKLLFINLDLYEFEIPDAVKPVSSCYLRFEIRDSNSNKIIPARVEIYRLKDKKYFLSETISEQKLISLPGDEQYAINILHEGYQFISENFNCSMNSIFEPEIKIWKMLPLVADSKPTILKNIFFESNLAELKKESYFELDHLVQILLSNKEYKVVLSGYTDNVGNVQDNLNLSSLRAKAVGNYLSSKGIDLSRISTIGYGEAHPIDSNSTEAGRKNNRRTEFLLTK
ncbi:MAG: OmpA family protein [Saprospiraceae bacterium]